MQRYFRLLITSDKTTPGSGHVYAGTPALLAVKARFYLVMPGARHGACNLIKYIFLFAAGYFVPQTMKKAMSFRVRHLMFRFVIGLCEANADLQFSPVAIDQKTKWMSCDQRLQ